MAASMGSQAQLAMEPLSGAFDTSSEPYEFVSESLKKTATILETDGIRGTRSHASERTRAGTYEINGQITLHPSPADLDLLLPRILGGAESVDSFPLAETLPEFGVMVDRVAKVFTYSGCKVSKATFKAAQGETLQLTLDLVGKTESVGNAGTYPALTLGTGANDAPYVFHEGVITLVSSARDMMDFELTIDNSVQARFTNSQTATDISAKDRIVTLKSTHPYTANETDLYAQANSGTTGSLVFTNGGMSTTFTFGVLQYPDNSPLVASKEEIPLVLEGIARKTGSTAELAVTHDSVA